MPVLPLNCMFYILQGISLTARCGGFRTVEEEQAVRDANWKDVATLVVCGAVQEPYIVAAPHQGTAAEVAMVALAAVADGLDGRPVT